MGLDPILQLRALVDFADSNPLLTVVYVICIICLATRVLTGLSVNSRPHHVDSHPSRPLTIPILPYWIPWLGHALPLSFGLQSYLIRLSRRTNLGVFGLWIGGRKHVIIKAPSMLNALLNDRSIPVDRESILLEHMTRVWDDQHSLRNMEQSGSSGPIAAALGGLMRGESLTAAVNDVKRNVEQRVYDLVSGSQSIVDQYDWERAGQVRLVNPQDGVEGKAFVAETYLRPLLRDFMGDIATTAIMGRNFMENNPDLLSDLALVDSRFMAFTLGVPNWFPGMLSATRARERVIRAVQDHHEALEKHLDGKDPGSRWNDMSDVSGVMIERVKAWKAANAPPRAYGSGDAVIMWALNNNSNMVLFWLIWYIYSNQSLLRELREEVASFVKKKSNGDSVGSRLPIKEAPQIEIDVQSLREKCPMLNGALMETMRLEAPVLTYRLAADDFVLTESEEDARHFGRKEAHSYLFSKGDLICMSQGVHSADSSYWPSPDKFDPQRFWVTDNEKASRRDEMKLDYKTMRVWSGGKSMCKGKKFAESEILMFAAAIIMCWDMEPSENNGKWKSPGRVPGPAVIAPKRNIRVKMWRREDW